MPHLAPLSWLIAPLMFFLLCVILMTLMWWQINPSFPPFSSNLLSTRITEWPWY